MKRETVVIHTPFIKLDALLKFCGATLTGGEAKDFILSGEVSVNGEICLTRGKKIYPGMSVCLGGETFEVAASEN